jgi:serine phosphatase RsbU (regulator of sigma subunit)
MIKYILTIILISLFGLSSKSQSINLDSAITALKNAKEDTNKVLLLNQIAWDISYESSYKGLEYGIKAYDLAKVLNYKYGNAKSAMTIGTIYNDIGDFSKALTYFHEAVDIEKKHSYLFLLGKTYSNMGILFASKKDLKKALEYYQKSANCFFNNKKSPQLAATFNNIGAIYADVSEYDSAKRYYYLALDINEHNYNETNIAGVNANLCSIFTKLGDYQKAIVHIDKAMLYCKKNKNSYDESNFRFIYGNLKFAQKDYDESILYYKSVMDFSLKAGVKDLLANAYDGLSQCYECKNDLKNALFYYKKHSEIKDSLANELNNKQVRNLEITYETENKNKAIELLTQKNHNQTLEADKRKLILYASLLALIGVGVLAFFLYNRAQQKHKTNIQLENVNNEIRTQKNLIEHKNKEITDSINYAQRIQSVLLTSENYIKKYLPDFFILNKPKDIVSGDFYWAVEVDDCFIMVTADCTGHGVPGAFMSLLGINYLNEIVIEHHITRPDLILNELRKSIIEALNPDGKEDGKDGMDLVLCKFDFKNKQLSFACANNPLWLLRTASSDAKPQLIEYKADKMPVGKGPKDKQPFTLKTIDLQKDDVIYTFTDGYADQFGGPKGKKFMYRKLKVVIEINCKLNLLQQKEALTQEMAEWQGKLEQVDDILVVGIKV